MLAMYEHTGEGQDITLALATAWTQINHTLAIGRVLPYHTTHPETLASFRISTLCMNELIAARGRISLRD